ncbi:MAG TPA: winged helix-turn-helix domain-containing protein [Vicinamibacterales bacterium]|nr:winged helix-turn-helix domain-containing protein [Vicinamibacterales bacterium]
MSQQHEDLLDFDVYTIDVGQRVLLSRGTPVPLSPKVFDTLLALAEEPGRVLEKDHLLTKIWPDTFVEEGSLARNVSTLRRVLGRSSEDQEYIETIPKRGYRFNAVVQRGTEARPTLNVSALLPADSASADGRQPGAAVEPSVASSHPRSRIAFAWGVGLVLVFASALVGWTLSGETKRPSSSNATTGVRSLAVLPLRPLQADGDDNYLGLGVADTIITRIGQIDGLTVRPTDAIRKFAAGDMDPFKAASELQVDAVLDGTLQRSGDQLRVNVSLFGTRDGVSLWSRTFDVDFKDIFTVEDAIAEDVASQLRLRLSASERQRLTRHQTTSPEAYEYYLKGIATFGTSGAASPTVIGDVKAGARLLEQAVRIDPDYALAHAQLASAYTQVALYSNAESPSAQLWIDRARAALARADALDSHLAESHIVRHLLLRSAYGDYQNLDAFEELRAARSINPKVVHYDIGAFLAEMGLLEAGLKELRLALEIDPTNETVQAEIPNAFWYSALYDQAIEENLKLQRSVPWAFYYYLGADRLAEAEKMIDELAVRNPADGRVAIGRAWLLARRGRYREAQALLPPVASRKLLTYHHGAYVRACIAALGSDTANAVHWLDETVDTGLPVYPAFARDKCFDPIRQTPQFSTFMDHLKPVWEDYERRMR